MKLADLNKLYIQNTRNGVPMYEAEYSNGFSMSAYVIHLSDLDIEELRNEVSEGSVSTPIGDNAPCRTNVLENEVGMIGGFIICRAC